MPHAARPDGAQHRRLRIALHGVEDVAAELRDEARGRGRDRRWPQAVQRIAWTLGAHELVDGRHRVGSLETTAQRRNGGTET